VADYIDTTWARHKIDANKKKIAKLQKELDKEKKHGKDTAATQQKIDDLTAENAFIQSQIDAQGISSKDVGGTTGNYATVPTSNSFKDPATSGGGGGSAADPVPQPGISRPILALVVLVVVGAVVVAWRIIKRKKRHG